MEYQNMDDAIKREACEKVKQIVKAIKAIKIKYYLNFSKISEKDQETYQNLESNLEKISNMHNLDNLKVALMSEVNARYNGESPEDMKQEQGPEFDGLLQACYGAVDAQKEALSKGRITQALRCQEQLKKYMQELDEIEYNEILNYKREKFAELMQSREQVDAQVESWSDKLKAMHKEEFVTLRKNMMEILQDIKSKEKQEDKEMEVSSI